MQGLQPLLSAPLLGKAPIFLSLSSAQVPRKPPYPHPLPSSPASYQPLLKCRKEAGTACTVHGQGIRGCSGKSFASSRAERHPGPLKSPKTGEAGWP